MPFGFPRAIPVCAALLWWQAEPEERTMKPNTYRIPSTVRILSERRAKLARAEAARALRAKVVG